MVALPPDNIFALFSRFISDCAVKKFIGFCGSKSDSAFDINEEESQCLFSDTCGSTV
jgi:hypothetical protein